MTSSSKIESPSLVYRYGKGLYVNLTSRCPTACRFCVKFTWNYDYRGFNLKLPADPSVREVLDAAPADLSPFEEIVFCGYGEGTYRMKEMEELSLAFRSRGARRVRLNTIGLGNLINDRDISPDLARFLDAVSISLNTVDPARYLDLMRPLTEYRGKALASVLEFIAACAGRLETTVTAVAGVSDDADAVRRAAESRGAKFLLRPFLD